MNALAINVADVVKSFPAGDTRTYALKGATLNARFGELLMIVGPSGCGKTTLLSVICGTLQCEEGMLNIFDHDLRRMKDAEITRFRCENVGFIFQQFNLIPTLTAVENASIPLILNGTSPRKAEKRAGEVLAEVGLGDKLRVEIADIDKRGKISLILVAEDDQADQADQAAAPAPAVDAAH